MSELVEGFKLGVLTKLLGKRQLLYDLGDEPIPVDWVTGAAMMIRREVLDDIGLLDGGYFLYFDEVDFCFRARLAGWPRTTCRIVSSCICKRRQQASPTTVVSTDQDDANARFAHASQNTDEAAQNKGTVPFFYSKSNLRPFAAACSMSKTTSIGWFSR